ncbi:MAG: DUF1189 family protein [Tatlockia sp.]
MKGKKKALRQIDEPIYRYWQALYYSFFNPQLYVDVGKRWKGYGIGYLLLLLFVVTIPFSARLALEFCQFFEDDLLNPIRQLPTLYIQKGEVSLDKPMPYQIKNKKNEVVAIVDTTGVVTSLNGAYPKLTTLITKDKLYYRFPSPQFFYSSEPITTPSPTYFYSFSKESNSVFEGKNWVKSSGIGKLKYFFGFLIYPSVAFAFFALFVVLLLVFALMGQLIAKLFKLSITYQQSARLVMVSITPFMVVIWSFFAFGILTNRFGIIMPLLIIFYFCFAVISLKRASHKLVAL